MPHYVHRSFNLDWKANRTEVTEADRDSGARDQPHVLAERPHHGLFGEEHGLVGDADSPWRWIIDPIDGTSQLRARHPGVGVAGGTHPRRARPGRRCRVRSRRWAARGGRRRAWARSPTASVLPRVDGRRDRRGTGQRHVRVGLGRPRPHRRVGALQQQAYRARGFGDFWQHMLVAEGAVDLAIDAVGPAALRPRRRDGDRRGSRRHVHRSPRRAHLRARHAISISSNGLLHLTARRC
jgi:histidinol-phosphatase